MPGSYLYYYLYPSLEIEAISKTTFLKSVKPKSSRKLLKIITGDLEITKIFDLHLTCIRAASVVSSLHAAKKSNNHHMQVHKWIEALDYW